MPGMILNCFEESPIKNRRLPEEWQSQSSLDELAEFLQLNWEQRSVFFDDGEITSRQQYLGFTGQRGIRTNSYVGTIAFKGHQLNIFPKVFREEKDDSDTDDLTLSHLMKNLVQWLQYCTRIDYPFISISSQLEDSEDLRELFITLYLMPNASLYHFGILESNVHMAWMRAVCGRLKSDYDYSIKIVYNNFPWPSPADPVKARIEQTAQAILDARALYPDCSLADLYDEVAMPPELRKAHQQNDKAVMQAYGFWGKLNTETECVAELMKMYQSLT